MTKAKLIQATILSTLLPVFLFSATPVFSAVRCETQYGGGQVCVKTGSIQINKQVQGKDGSWNDNLGQQSGTTFKLGEIVTYRLHVSNVGDAKFDTVTVTDTLPGQVQLAEGNLTNTINNLEAGKSQDIFIKAKVTTSPSTVDCNVWNTGEVRTNDNQYDKDMSQICIGEAAPVVAPKTLPKSGPEDTFPFLALSAFAAISGLGVLKYNQSRLRI
jgi:uncharacterized repeat protein (TIGR01451 family)